MAFCDGLAKEAKELTTKGRKAIKPENFVFPGEKRYPIHDEAHARNALSRVAQFGSDDEKSKVRAAVHHRYPGIGKTARANPDRAFTKGLLTGTAAGMGGAALYSHNLKNLQKKKSKEKR